MGTFPPPWYRDWRFFFFNHKAFLLTIKHWIVHKMQFDNMHVQHKRSSRHLKTLLYPLKICSVRSLNNYFYHNTGSRTKTWHFDNPSCSKCFLSRLVENQGRNSTLTNFDCLWKSKTIWSTLRKKFFWISWCVRSGAFG